MTFLGSTLNVVFLLNEPLFDQNKCTWYVRPSYGICDPNFVGKKNNRERNAGINMVNNIFFVDEEKNGDGKGDEIWRRKIYLFAQEKKDGEGIGGQYLEEKRIFLRRR